MGDASSVHVDPDALRKYGLELATKGQMQTLHVIEHIGNLAPLVQSLTTPTDAGTFAEGAVIAGIMMQASTDFATFARELTSGLHFIGSAAAVIATAYRNGDVQSAQDIGVIDFAFGDPLAHKPAGLKGHDQTYSEQAAEAAAKAPQMSMAALGMDAFITTRVPLGYSTIYIYQDGSSRTSTYGMPSTFPGVAGTTSTMAYTDANGKVIGSSSTTKGTNGSGLQTEVSVESQGGQQVTVVSTHNADGSVTVDTTRPGPDGKATTATVTTHPHSGSTADQGPVQQAENQYNLPQYGW
ncbi:MAG: hypothetical protein V7603_6846 [Micromonosporaceae bacterium]